jgi:hypothetical protein
MAKFVKDSGWDDLRGTVEQCDDCENPTIHLAAPGGVPVCSMCGYNPLLDELMDEDDNDDTPSNVIFFPRNR